MVGTTKSGLRILSMHGNALEGFSCEESVFIARLLRALGVKTLVQTMIAGKSLLQYYQMNGFA